jgi:hypothetical protein
MPFIRIIATEVFEGSYDTLALLIGEERDMIFAFNGFMDSINDFSTFRPEEMIIYKGSKAREIYDAFRNGKYSMEDESSRNVEITDEIKKRIVDWMFFCEHLVLM